MPTGSMWRVTATVTGVAGAPYYLRGYFDALGGTAQDAQDDWFDFINPTAGGLVAGAVLETEPLVDAVNPVTGQTTSQVAVVQSTLTGTGVNEILPLTTQTLVRWRTGIFVAGREVRGRTFIPLPYETANAAGGVPIPAHVSAYTGKAIALIGSANSSLVVWSKKNGLWEEAITGSCWNQWAVLRSRRD